MRKMCTLGYLSSAPLACSSVARVACGFANANANGGARLIMNWFNCSIRLLGWLVASRRSSCRGRRALLLRLYCLVTLIDWTLGTRRGLVPYVHPVPSLPYKLLASLPRVEKGMRLTEPAAVSYIFNIPDRPVGSSDVWHLEDPFGLERHTLLSFLTYLDYDGLDKGLDSGLEYRTYFGLGIS
ncbi:hypothetical protein F4806DRAFT_275440 [Annulohypoxylon nitens]|nr:hypothetical protein F4806DRAFT_275440 [Annulohypoxylon nitens]